MRRGFLGSSCMLALAAAAACSDTQDFRTAGDGPAGVDGGAGVPDASSTLPAAGADGAARSPVAVELARGQGLDPKDTEQQGIWTIVSDSTWVTWIDAWSHVARVPKSGGKVEDLGDISGSPAVFALGADHLYFTNVDLNRIERMPKGGGAVEPVTPSHASDGSYGVQQLALDKAGARITWIDGRRALRCESVPCTQPSQVTDLGLDTSDEPTSLAISGSHVFVSYLPFDPKNPQQLLPNGGISALGEGGQVAITPLDYGTVFCDVEPADARLTVVFATSQNLIVRADFPGAFAPKVLASGDDADMYPGPLVDGGAYLYWLTHGGGKPADSFFVPGSIMRVKKDGSEKPEIVYKADAGLRGLAGDTDTLFFSTNDGRLMKLARPADGRLH